MFISYCFFKVQNESSKLSWELMLQSFFNVSQLEQITVCCCTYLNRHQVHFWVHPIGVKILHVIDTSISSCTAVKCDEQRACFGTALNSWESNSCVWQSCSTEKSNTFVSQFTLLNFLEEKPEFKSLLQKTSNRLLMKSLACCCQNSKKNLLCFLVTGKESQWNPMKMWQFLVQAVSPLF